jgi:4-amino-4-deoxy-L-arabinose transferase-like glycosyltransferase
MIAEAAAGRGARFSRGAVAVAATVVVAFVLRVAWIAYADFQPTLSDDAGRYHLLGQSLTDGAGYINPNGTTTMFWPPGYPFVLAAMFKAWPADALGEHELTLALLLNATLGALTCALVYGIGRRAFDERVGIIGAVVTAVFPSLVFLAGLTLTETVFTFLALLGLWLIVEARARERREWVMLAVAALVIGYAALVRGQALLLPIVAAPFWLYSLRDVRATALRVAGVGVLAVLVVLPWTARNWIESGSPVLLSSNAGVDFYIGHSEGADGRGRIVDELVFRYPELPQAVAEARINRDGFREGIEYALTHPVRELELAARKLFFLYHRDDEAFRWSDGHGERALWSSSEHRLWVVVSNVFYLAVIAPAAVGFGLMLLRWRSSGDANRMQIAAQLLLVSVVAYWTVVHMAFFGDPRFHAPIMPVVGLWVAVGQLWVTRRGLSGTS